jgi:ribosomal subunit interface protein
MLKIEISGVHYEATDELKKYIYKKIGKIDGLLPKHAKQSAHAEVKLRQSKTKDKKQFTCEVILHLPDENITIHESTVNMFAAVDIVEAKLKNQLKKYKDKRTFGRHREVVHGVWRKVRRSR